MVTGVRRAVPQDLPVAVEVESSYSTLFPPTSPTRFSLDEEPATGMAITVRTRPREQGRRRETGQRSRPLGPRGSVGQKSGKSFFHVRSDDTS